ncbi:MAG: sigma-70 family RNA polymerase sigma factor [Chloroflexi bacterium]|nr:sigma-70 family RNA polymerase sigma factor [Chloroflexota bacterium]
MLDEKDLVEKAVKGDMASFAGLYELYFDRIYRYIIVRIWNKSEAEDLTEQVFINAIESIGSFKWKGKPFSAWLFRIAHNLLIDYHRKKNKNQEQQLEESIVASGPGPELMAELNISMEQLSAAILKLTDLQKQVVSLRFAGGLSITETAAVMGKNENAVKALQHSAVEALHRYLAGNK